MMLRLMRNLAEFGTWVGGTLLVAVALLVTSEVVLRRFFGIGLAAASELSGYAMAIAAAWGFSYAVIHRSHVRVDAAVRLLPNRIATWIDVLAMVMLTFYAYLLVAHGWEVFHQSWIRNSRAMTPLLTPMWIPQAAWWLGLCLFFTTCTVTVVRAIYLKFSGRDREARELVGAVTVEEEAEAEISETEKMFRGASR
jgi:TRAP-type C4-dicarboxylate transport system permease small subunit